MNKLNPAVKFFLNLGRTESILSNRFDRGLGGLSFSEFLILFYVSQSEDEKMRRVDLAEKIGMTASGVTRLLLPMEKVRLIKTEENETDARVRAITLTAAGKEKLIEAISRLEEFAEDIIPEEKIKELDKISDFLIEIGGKTLMV